MKVRLRFHGTKTCFTIDLPEGVKIPRHNPMLVIDDVEGQSFKSFEMKRDREMDPLDKAEEV